MSHVQPAGRGVRPGASRPTAIPTAVLVLVALLAWVTGGPSGVAAQTIRPANDAFIEARVLAGDSGSVSQSAQGATREVGEPHIGLADSGRFSTPGSVWFVWSAAQTGTVEFTVTADAGAGAVTGPVHASAVEGDALGALRELGAADSGVSAELVLGPLEVVAGHSYRLVVATETQGVTVRWQAGAVAAAPGNDETPALLPFTSAPTVGFGGAMAIATNTGATHTAGEPAHGTVGGTHSVWFRYAANDEQIVQFDTYGSRFDTGVGVYTAGRVRLAANDDAIPGVARHSATAWVRVRSGQSILVAVDGRAGAHGAFTLHWITRAPGPANDFFADATVINGSGSDVFSPADATFEDGETSANAPGSLWYRYSSPLAGTVRFSFGDDVDGAYEGRVSTGPDIPRLVSVAGLRVSRSSTGQYPSASVDSGPIAVQAGTPLSVAVGGFALSDTAPLPRLRWSFTPDSPPPTTPTPPRMLQRFTPVEPTRVLDTRGGGAMAAGTTKTLVLAGRAGVPASGATAVIVNLTATESTGRGFLTTWPSEASGPPATSNINTLAGETIANLAMVPIGAGGSINITTSVETHLLVDVVGWVGPAGTGGYVPVQPTRLLDTRTRSAGRMRADEVVSVAAPPLADGSVPTAVVVNLTATDAVDPAFVTAFPDARLPDTSNLNVSPGQTAANLAIVRVGSDGLFRLRSSGSTHLLVDLAGMFAPSSSAELHLVTPSRIRDDRTAATTAFPTPAGQNEQIGGRAGVPADATGVVVNVTTVEQTTPGGVYPAVAGYVQLGAAGAPDTATSNLNFRPGADTANLAIVPLGADGRISLRASTRVPVILDVIGWYG